MKIVVHGGRCCGIKTIHSLGGFPKGKLAARKKLTTAEETSFIGTYSWETGASSDMSQKCQLDFFADAAPKESYVARFSRFIKYIKKHRPHGLIEVAINPSTQSAWVPFLKRRGFRMVSEFTNSNTSSTVQSWHLVY